jgi:hypothetical protein
VIRLDLRVTGAGRGGTGREAGPWMMHLILPLLPPNSCVIIHLCRGMRRQTTRTIYLELGPFPRVACEHHHGTRNGALLLADPPL